MQSTRVLYLSLLSSFIYRTLYFFDDCRKNCYQFVALSQNFLCLFMREVPDSARRRSQYFVSLASLRAIEYFETKSALLCAACPSSIFEPTNVPDRRKCLLITLPTHGLPDNSCHKETIGRNTVLLQKLAEATRLLGLTES